MSKEANNRRHKIWHILKYTSVESALTAREIHQYLLKAGYSCNKKTVERDLSELSRRFGLSSEGTRPVKYFSPQNFNFQQEIVMDFYSLETLYIALQNLKETSHGYFADQIGECEAVLFENLSKELVEELEYIREKYFFDYGLAGKPNDENVENIKKILYALREEKYIECNNLSPYKGEDYNSRLRRLAPLYFILSAGMPYLMAKDLDDLDSPVKRFRISRLKSVEIKKLFDIDDFKSQYESAKCLGGWGGANTELVEIKIHGNEEVGTYFTEKTLHLSQKVDKLNEDEFLISMKVPLSSELTKKLAGFGGAIHHISPQPLFDDVISIWESGLANLKKAA